MTKEEIEKRIEFTRELMALEKKHGLAIDGCGCCGSPRLYEFDDNLNHYDGELAEWRRDAAECHE